MISFVFCFLAATRSCFLQDWSNSFNKEGETQCESSSGYYNLVGFERDGNDNLQGIKKAKCCARDRTFWNTPPICQMPDGPVQWTSKTISHIRILGI